MCLVTWLSRLPTLLLALVAVLAGGCASISGNVLRDNREKFNEVIQITNAEQLLQNIVRLRYANSPYFLEISSVSTSATMGGTVGIFGNTAAPATGLSPNIVISPGITFSQTPSFVFQPLTGEKFARQLLRPVDLRTLALLRTAGWDLQEILLVMVDSINGVPNAPTATQFAPDAIPDNAEFRRIVDLLDRLEETGLIELGLDSATAPQDSRSDVVLSLQIDRAAAATPDGKELVRRLSLDPTIFTYRLAAAAGGGGGKNIAIKPRSVLAAMRYLSKGIEIPDADVAAGFVPVLRKPDGSAFDWMTLLSDVFRIRATQNTPPTAYIRIQHQGHWFFIDNADLASKQTFALIETTLALQAGDVPAISTVLTLPIAR